MKKPVNYYQAQERLTKGEDYTGLVSKTVPNQSLTVNDILTRFSRGQPIQGERQIYYDEQVDPTKSPDFDLSDVTNIENELLTKQAAIYAENEAKIQAERINKAELEAKTAARLAELELKEKNAEKINK